jgi:hypothetical protein
MKSRRKAISAELVRESKDNPGYFRYNIEIEEVDGTSHKVPAYGKDMEDALERLVWVERVEKKPFNVVVISALLTIIIVPSVIAAITNSPLFLLGALALAIAYGFVMVRVDKYFNKK